MAHNDDESNARNLNNSPKPILAASAMLLFFAGAAILVMQPEEAHEGDTDTPEDARDNDAETDVSSDDPGVHNQKDPVLLMLACKNPCNSEPCCGLIPEEVL